MELNLTAMSNEWQGLSKQEQQQHLFDKLKNVLDAFLARRVISQEQYDISLHTLMDNMGVNTVI